MLLNKVLKTADISDGFMNDDENVDPLAVIHLQPKWGWGGRRHAICAQPRGNRGIRTCDVGWGKPPNYISIDNLDNGNDREINENWIWEKNTAVNNNNDVLIPIKKDSRVRMKDIANVLDPSKLYLIKNILTHTMHETNWCAKSYLEKHNKKLKIVILANGKILTFLRWKIFLDS